MKQTYRELITTRYVKNRERQGDEILLENFL